MTTLRASDGFRYQLSEQDYEWLLRAAAGEGGEASRTIWTWLQRFAQPQWRERFPTLTALVRAHSQPVNPIWARGGSRCGVGGLDADAERCSEQRLQRRDFFTNADLRTIAARHPDDLAAVQMLKLGLLWNRARGADDFADPPTSQAFIREHPGTQIVVRGENWYLRTTEAQALNLRVWITSTWKWAIWIGLGIGTTAALGGLGYYLWRRFR